MKLPALRIVGLAYRGALERAREFILIAVPALFIILTLSSALILVGQSTSAVPEIVRNEIHRSWWIVRAAPVAIFQAILLYLYLENKLRLPQFREIFRTTCLKNIAKTTLFLLLLWAPFIYFLPFQTVQFLDALRSGQSGSLHLIAVAGILIWTYAMTRISPIAAAACLNTSMSLGSAWKITSGSGLRLFGVYLLCGLPLFILAVAVWVKLTPRGMFLDAPSGFLTAYVVSDFLRLIAAAVLAVAIAEAYRWLTSRPRSDDQTVIRFE